jgi:hypothetical protein
MHKLTLKLSYIVLLSNILLILSNKKDYRPLILTSPPSGIGNTFTSKCWGGRVQGFNFNARCRDNSGIERISSVNFFNCAKNYEGDLHRFDGRVNELPKRNCGNSTYRLICDCEQPSGEYKSCIIGLDYIFYVVNGQLRC